MNPTSVQARLKTNERTNEQTEHVVSSYNRFEKERNRIDSVNQFKVYGLNCSNVKTHKFGMKTICLVFPKFFAQIHS
jgi:hypothetical protein